MPGGWMVGLGQGIAKAGDVYANAKQEAIQRMFRERQLAMQQQELEDRIRGGEFRDAFQMMGALPEGTQISLDQFGTGGEPVVRAFSKMQTGPDANSPVGAAHSIATPITMAPTLDATTAPPPPNAGTLAAQQLGPTVTQRVSIPTEDAKFRAAQMNELGRNSRFQQSDATRNRIAQEKMALQTQLFAETDANRKVAIAQRWKQLDDMDKMISISQGNQNITANNMDYDNMLNAWKAANPTGHDPSQDPMAQVMAQIIAKNSGLDLPQTPAGGPAGKPALTPPKPTPVRGAGRVYVQPDLPSTDPYDEYLRQRQQQPKK